jgi:hypothetical protein
LTVPPLIYKKKRWSSGKKFNKKQICCELSKRLRKKIMSAGHRSKLRGSSRRSRSYWRSRKLLSRLKERLSERLTSSSPQI